MTIREIINMFSYKGNSCIFFTSEDIEDENFDYRKALDEGESSQMFRFGCASDSHIFSSGLGYPFFVIVMEGEAVFKDRFTPTPREEEKCENYLYDDGDYECDFDEDEEENEDDE